jgi:magnesium-transporting ATPase (P-type)
MEVYNKFDNGKKGFTRVDSVHLSIIIFMLTIYIILIIKESSEDSSIDNKRYLSDDNQKDPNTVSAYDIIISIWGFILGLFISSFVTRFLFREYSNNIAVITIIFIISIIALITYYILVNYQNKQISTPLIKYNQIIFPLLGGLFLIAEDSINHFFNYFGGNQEKYSGGFNLEKFAGSLNEVRNALAKNKILSDTSTDYMGGSTSIFTPTDSS